MTQRGKISVMVFFFSICGSAALLTSYDRIHSRAFLHKELYDVVCRQLDAFRAEDFNRAYQETSSGIQHRLSLDDFTRMIRANYPGITAGRVELGAIRFDGDRAFIEVFFIDERGSVQPCVYNLINEGDLWKVDGARMLPRWPSGQSLSGTQT